MEYPDNSENTMIIMTLMIIMMLWSGTPGVTDITATVEYPVDNDNNENNNDVLELHSKSYGYYCLPHYNGVTW